MGSTPTYDEIEDNHKVDNLSTTIFKPDDESLISTHRTDDQEYSTPLETNSVFDITDLGELGQGEIPTESLKSHKNRPLTKLIPIPLRGEELDKIKRDVGLWPEYDYYVISSGQNLDFKW